MTDTITAAPLPRRIPMCVICRTRPAGPAGECPACLAAGIDTDKQAERSAR